MDEIAAERGFVTGTIYTHLTTALEAGEPVDIKRVFTAAEQEEMAGAFAKCGWGNLLGAIEALQGKFDHGKLRFFRASRGMQRSGERPVPG